MICPKTGVDRPHRRNSGGAWECPTDHFSPHMSSNPINLTEIAPMIGKTKRKHIFENKLFSIE